MLHGLVALRDNSHDTARGLQAPPVRAQASALTRLRGGRAPARESLHTALLLHEGRVCPARRRSQHGDRVFGSREPSVLGGGLPWLRQTHRGGCAGFYLKAFSNAAVAMSISPLDGGGGTDGALLLVKRTVKCKRQVSWCALKPAASLLPRSSRTRAQPRSSRREAALHVARCPRASRERSSARARTGPARSPAHDPAPSYPAPRDCCACADAPPRTLPAWRAAARTRKRSWLPDQDPRATEHAWTRAASGVRSPRRPRSSASPDTVRVAALVLGAGRKGLGGAAVSGVLRSAAGPGPGAWSRASAGVSACGVTAVSKAWRGGGWCLEGGRLGVFREAGRLWWQPVAVDGVRVDTGVAGGVVLWRGTGQPAAPRRPRPPASR